MARTTKRFGTYRGAEIIYDKRNTDFYFTVGGERITGIENRSSDIQQVILAIDAYYQQDNAKQIDWKPVMRTSINVSPGRASNGFGIIATLERLYVGKQNGIKRRRIDWDNYQQWNGDAIGLYTYSHVYDNVFGYSCTDMCIKMPYDDELYSSLDTTLKTMDSLGLEAFDDFKHDVQSVAHDDAARHQIGDFVRRFMQYIGGQIPV